MTTRVLMAGVGNVFFGDDGFGVAVARRLLRDPRPLGVTIVDYGIRSVHLAFDLMDSFDRLVIADTVARGGEPGTLYVIDPEIDDLPVHPRSDGHGMDLVAVFAMARGMGARLPLTRIVGCEPASLEAGMDLSPAVAAAIDPAVGMVRRLYHPETPNHEFTSRQAELC